MRAATALVAGALVVAATPPAGAAETRTEYTRTVTVSGWGGFDSGQSRTPASLVGKQVVAISAGDDNSLALTSDGAVTGWGWNGDGQTVAPADLRNGSTKVAGIDAGEYHSLAVLRDGSVRAWGAKGDTDEGQADVPASLAGPNPATPVAQVAAGRYHSLALTRAGTVVAWGAEENHGDIDAGQTLVPGVLADGSRHVVDVAAGSQHSLAVDDTGRIWAWGSHDQQQVDYPAVLDQLHVVDVAAYGAASLALLDDGRVVGWGDAGTGTTTYPARFAGKKVVAIDVGSETAMALTASGEVLVWGDTGTAVPRALAAHAPFSGIAAGGRHELVMHRAPKVTTKVFLSAPARVKKGKPVTVTVRLTGVSTGSVVVKDGSRRLGVVKVGKGTGRLVVRGLAIGRHRLVAAYAGTATTTQATSATTTLEVTR